MLKPPVNNSFVIATILMEPCEGRLHVRFGAPTTARGGSSKKKRKRQKGAAAASARRAEGAAPTGGGDLADGITDWRQMETAKSLLPPYTTYALGSCAAVERLTA